MLEVTNKTRASIPPLPFERIFHKIFNNRTIDISLVFVGDSRMRSMNRKYRNKDKTTNVLSFPLDDSVAEIFICVNQAKREARKLNMSFDRRVTELLVHGLFHIKGFDHENDQEAEHMEGLEHRILTQI